MTNEEKLKKKVGYSPAMYHCPQSHIHKGMEELIRDITKAGFMPKSLARRRMQDIILLAQKELLERVKLKKSTMKFRDKYLQGRQNGYNYAIKDLETLKKSIKKGL